MIKKFRFCRCFIFRNVNLIFRHSVDLFIDFLNVFIRLLILLSKKEVKVS